MGITSSATDTAVVGEQVSGARTRNRWDATPVIGAGAASAGGPAKRKRWDATPVIGAGVGVGSMAVSYTHLTLPTIYSV